MGAHGRVRLVLLCTIYILKLASYDNIAMASTISPSGLQARSVIFQSQEKSQSDALSSSMVLYVNVTSAVEVSIAVTTAERFSSVKNSVVSPGPTVTVGSPKRTLIEAQPSKGAHTAVSLDAASFTSMVLSLPQVSVQPTPALTEKPTATSSVNARSVLFQSQEMSQSDALSSSMVLNVNVTSAVEVSIALTATKRFSSVINSVVSPGPTITVGSPYGTLIEVQPSKGAHTAVSFDAASFTSTVLLSAQVSVQPTPVLTVKSTTTPSLNVDGCKNYKVLNGVDRAQGYTLPAQQRCDRDLELGWYRFQGLAGDQMADTCVPMLRCGTVASGWLSGLHPTVADGVVLRKICYNWLSCCGHSDDIQVRNCGSFFVYELKKPPSCNLRYCGNGSANYMCSALPAPPNGIKFGCPENAIVFNDTACQFSCNDGYIGSGSQQRRCQPNGTWSGQDFPCQIINCTLLTTDPAGPLRMSSCDNQYGAQCNFSCAIGYRLKGSSTVRCVAPGNLHPGVWNNAIPRCEAVTCPRLSPPSNGELLGCNTTEMLYKTICGFSCNEGFEAKGSVVRRCTENGTWSGTDLVCDEGNDCILKVFAGHTEPWLFTKLQASSVNAPVNLFEKGVIGSQTSLAVLGDKCYGFWIHFYATPGK